MANLLLPLVKKKIHVGAKKKKSIRVTIKSVLLPQHPTFPLLLQYNTKKKQMVTTYNVKGWKEI